MSIIQLELTNASALLSNLNTRTEKAGPDDVPAADLNIECNRDRDVLAFFSPTLRAHLFDEKGPKDLADGVQLQHPEIKGAIPIEGEMTGATVRIDFGVAKPMELTDVKIGKFKIEPKEGGTVALSFQINCKPDEKQIGKLYMLQKQSITISIEPAELPQMQAAP